MSGNDKRAKTGTKSSEKSQGKNTPASIRNDRREILADIILSMNFGELYDLAEELVDMVEDTNNDRNFTQIGIARTLYDWAEAELS